MDEARRAKVFERRNLTIEALEHKAVATLQTTAGGRVARVPGEFIEPVADPTDDAGEPPFDGRMRGADENWRREFFGENEGSGMHLDDTRDGEANISRLPRLPNFVS